MPFKIWITNHSLPVLPIQKGHHNQRGLGRKKTPVVSQMIWGKNSREI